MAGASIFVLPVDDVQGVTVEEDDWSHVREQVDRLHMWDGVRAGGWPDEDFDLLISVVRPPDKRERTNRTQ